MRSDARKRIQAAREEGCGERLDGASMEDFRAVAAEAVALRKGIEELVAKWSGCWCGPQLAYDHDPRVQDCPQHGDGAAEHFCGAIVTDLRAVLDSITPPSERTS